MKSAGLVGMGAISVPLQVSSSHSSVVAAVCLAPCHLEPMTRR